MSHYLTTVLDMTDDFGHLLKLAYPDRERLPESVKTASISPENPELYALVLRDGAHVIKKFATADEGSTCLSTLYFSQTRHSLPPEAIKVAAVNLLQACEAFDLDVPEFLIDCAKGDPIDTNYVDVTGKLPEPRVKTAEAKTFALGDRYPIDTVKGVALAQSYFEEKAEKFTPPQRREYATKVASEAAKYGLPLKEGIDKYAGALRRDDVESALTARGVLIYQRGGSVEEASKLIGLSKIATELSGDEFAKTLYDFDCKNKLNQLYGRELQDPWQATFHPMSKVAERETKRWLVGAETFFEEDLVDLVTEYKTRVINYFGNDFANKLEVNPAAVFESLPLPQKKAIVHLARDV